MGRGRLEVLVDNAWRTHVGRRGGEGCYDAYRSHCIPDQSKTDNPISEVSGQRTRFCHQALARPPLGVVGCDEVPRTRSRDQRQRLGLNANALRARHQLALFLTLLVCAPRPPDSVGGTTALPQWLCALALVVI